MSRRKPEEFKNKEKNFRFFMYVFIFFGFIFGILTGFTIVDNPTYSNYVFLSGILTATFFTLGGIFGSSF